MAGLTLALAIAVGHAGGQTPSEFSTDVTALPFPPDARELEFVAPFEDVKYNSHSPLNSLAAFYLKEMALRGWEHDEPAARIEKDSIKLTFRHAGAAVKLDLRQASREVRVSLDCDKLDFTGTRDPQKLAAAGIPVPRAALFVQKELPPPAGAVDLRYTSDGCTFKSSWKLAEAFDHYMRLVPGKGFRESRKPIVTQTRRYTEFKKGTADMSVNVFTDAVGSRIVLTYKDAAQETPVPPLAAVAALPIKNAAADKAAAASPASPPAGTIPIDVTGNKGSVTVSYAGRQYTFAHVAAYRTKSGGNSVTMVVFSARPIPVNKLQTLLATKDSVSFGDLYDFALPEHLVLQLGDHLSFSFSGRGVAIGRSIEKPDNKLNVAESRVQGTLSMPPIEVFKGEAFSFAASVDAAIITPATRLAGPADPVLRSDSAVLASAPLAFPDGVENAGREGSKFRKTYTAVIARPVAEVTAFFRQELAAKGWQPPAAAGDTVRLKSDTQELALTLKAQGGKTAVELITRDIALARQQGVLPEPGKGRLIFGNATGAAVTFAIGNARHTLKPGQGAEDHKQAVNQSLPPGTYTVTIQAPGRPPQTEKIELADGSAWGIIALPMGGALPLPLY